MAEVSIVEALAALDVDNDEHWTDDGAPRMSVLKDLTGQDVTRQQVTDAAPKFSRGNPSTDAGDDDTNEGDAADGADSDSGDGESTTEAPSPRTHLVITEEQGRAEYERLGVEIGKLAQARQELDAEMTQLRNQQKVYQRFAKSTEYDHREDMKRRMEYVRASGQAQADRESALVKAAARPARGARRPQFNGSTQGAKPN